MAAVKNVRIPFAFAIIVLCNYIFSAFCNESRLIDHKPVILENVLNLESVSLNKSYNILLWTPKRCLDCAPFPAFKSGNDIFKQHNCEYQNCYIHPNERRLPDVNPENYDAIMFNGRPIEIMGLQMLPQIRRVEQIYIFVQLESADRFPVCKDFFDDFFNWTMTYRLDSDIPWTYFEVKTKENVTVGPDENIKWISEGDLQPISDVLKTTLSNKSKLAAWFVSNCYAGNSKRINFVKRLKDELKRIDKQLSVDIFGKCGPFKCYKNESARCNSLIDRDYRFYMAMENSFDKDYITEKVMKPLLYNALPVVYSAANYTRFLPPGSYLDAKELGPRELAKRMHELNQNKEEYYKYFKWKSEYRFNDNFSQAEVACKLCKKLNTYKNTTRHLKFREWWNKDYKSRC